MSAPYRIVFMGTPDFAVPALEALYHSRHDVVGVVTQPDRPRGRGRKINATPIKRRAAQLGLPLMQPASLKNDEFANLLAGYQPDLLVVAAFGHILRPRLLDIPALGAINIHASLLPKYRGPAPIQWAVINGEAETGVTTMQMKSALDTGDILMTSTTAIGPADTAGSVHDRLSTAGAALIIETLTRLQAGTLAPEAQDHTRATYAPLLKKSDGRIDWHQPAAVIDRFVRGMSPWPGAFTFLGPRRLKIIAAQALTANPGANPGTVLKTFPGELHIACASGVLALAEIQAASGKRLDVETFMRGCPLPPGTLLE